MKDNEESDSVNGEVDSESSILVHFRSLLYSLHAIPLTNRKLHRYSLA